jgi:acyl transferase domain-containing protein
MESNTDYRSLLKRALQRINALERALAQTGRESQQLAIVGIGCRLPGDSDTPGAFWKFVREGRDAVTEVPPERWDVEAYYDPDPAAPGKTFSRHGSFLKDIDQFDPEFFGIAPREALGMDPQQRLLLEVVWEALENAGHNPAALSGSKTGVFIGIWSNDYSTLQVVNQAARLDMYFGAGNSHSIASGRISYILGLRGPCASIDTACSSSLLAAHMACRSLRMGECDLALAGGVNLMLSPQGTIIAGKGNMLSRDGRCKTFDASADGYVRGEGCGIVVLKRLSDAIAQRDHIYAVIRGSATNHDGRSNGLSAPSARAQEEVIRSALSDAKISPEEVHYIEAHGTGTYLGDPIEMQALGEVFERSHSRSHPLLVGTVKTNIGHLEACAGVAGLIKTSLMLQQKEIPPHLHLKNANPLVPWEQLPFEIPQKRASWPEGRGRRIAGISSFGFSGSNVHMILEEAPPQEIQAPGAERSFQLLTLSAQNAKAIPELAGSYERHLAAHPEDAPADVCFTANTGRAHLKHRLAVVAESSARMRQLLGMVAEGNLPEGVFSGRQRPDDGPATAFLFTGQGAQYAGMGRELFETQPTFRRTLEMCSELLADDLDRPLLSVIYPSPGETSPLDETAYTQPALFAFEYALAELWRSWGIEPAVVMGHSVGEYVAACIAGVFSLQDGLRLVAARARLMQNQPHEGGMAAVFADEKTVAAAIAPFKDAVAIAALNGPRNSVISGAADQVRAVLRKLKVEGIEAKILNVSHAFHSPLMEPILDDFEKIAGSINYAPPTIALISNVSGRLASHGEITQATYWRAHIRRPVQFYASMETLREQGCEYFIEIGPDPVLLGMAKYCLPDEQGLWLPSIKKGQNDWRQMLESLGRLYVQGVEIDWTGFDENKHRRRIVLPTYPFQRKRYWIPEAKQRHDDQGMFLAEINASVSPSQDVRESSLADWFYEVQWRPKDIDPGKIASSGASEGLWLLFADHAGTAAALKKRLDGQGRTCITVFAGDHFQVREDGSYLVNPLKPEDFQSLFDAVLAGSQSVLEAVVHLWSLDCGQESAGIDFLERAEELSCGSILHLVQALVRGALKPSFRLWLITRGSQSAGDVCGPANLGHMPLWGLGRVIVNEHPELHCTMVDLDLAGIEASLDQLVTEMGGGDREDQIAFRENCRYVARLVHLSSEARSESKRPLSLPGGHDQRALDQHGMSDNFEFKSGERTTPASETAGNERTGIFDAEAAYLITGGLGGIGLKLTGWMVEHGARHLFLMGRSEPRPDAQKAIEVIQAKGAKVTIARGDVSRPDDVQSVFESIKSNGIALRGIIHAAGVLDDGVLLHQQWQRFAKVLAAKVKGAWLLHQFSRNFPLDFFVLFSSTASILGGMGQGNYAAANAFMDGLAQFRRTRGMTAQSIAWGPWGGNGMAASLQDHYQRRLIDLGFYPMSPAQGLSVLKSLFDVGAVHIAVMSVEWSKLLGGYQNGQISPILDEMAHHVAAFEKAGPESKSGGTDLKQRLDMAPESERLEIVLAFVSAELTRVMGLDPSQPLDLLAPFGSIGLDSLMAVELRNAITVATGKHFLPSLAYDYPSIERLSDYLLKEIFDADESPVAPKEIAVPPSLKGTDRLAALESLSDEEVERLYHEKGTR